MILTSHIFGPNLCSYCRRSNYASFLFLLQNTTFQTGNFQWYVTFWKLISYCWVTQISWLENWRIIIACHRWCILKAKAHSRYGRDIVGSERWHAVATATAVPHSFSASGVIRGYHVYQRIWTPHVREKATMVREPGNEHDRFTVAVFEDEKLCKVGHFGSRASFGSLLK